ncbi:MAG: hypothetical protein RBS25_06380 [Bacilli bacterium]|jgi:hypothetical protein|nr:hypothetical protein [Bacilli bacterium]
MESKTKELKEYEKPTAEVVVFTLEEGIAESMLSGSDLICVEETE